MTDHTLTPAQLGEGATSRDCARLARLYAEELRERNATPRITCTGEVWTLTADEWRHRHYTPDESAYESVRWGRLELAIEDAIECAFERYESGEESEADGPPYDEDYAEEVDE